MSICYSVDKNGNARKDNNAPYASVESIGPKEADQLLIGNSQNYRRIKPRLVAKYASDMRGGRWTLTTTAIGIDVNGLLTNGQHRLSAVKESGVICQFIVVRNLPETAAKDPNEDTGSRRSISTHLQSAGVANAVSVASVARFLWSVKTSGKKRAEGDVELSDSVIAEMVAADDSITEAASITISAKSVAKGSTLGAWFWFAAFENRELAEDCIAILGGHKDASTSHPFAKCREVFMQYRMQSKNRGGMCADSEFRYLMSAWDKAKAGQTVKLLRPAVAIKISDAADFALQGLGK